MPFGDKWRKQRADYWDAMAERSSRLPLNDTLAAEVMEHGSVIEVGCGGGHLARLFFDAGYAGDYWACDISEAAAEAARARLGDRATVEVGQFEVLCADGRVPTADLVVARSVVQHQAHWLPVVLAALDRAPRVALGIFRSIYFKLYGEHEARSRGTYFDVCVSLEAMEREAVEAGIRCAFAHSEGWKGPEVVISLWR